MFKILATCAAVAVTALIALPGPADASERRADGARNADQIEVSSARRNRRAKTTRRYYQRSYDQGYYGPRSYNRGYYVQRYNAPHYGYAPRRAPFPFVFGW